MRAVGRGVRARLDGGDEGLDRGERMLVDGFELHHVPGRGGGLRAHPARLRRPGFVPGAPR